MFSTLYNFFCVLFNLFWIILWIIKLAWKLVLVVYFFYGVLNIIFLIHKLCKYLEEEKHRELLSKPPSISTNAELIQENTFERIYSFNDTISIYSENSSRRSSEEFVVTSWDQSNQVRIERNLFWKIWWLFYIYRIQIMKMMDIYQHTGHKNAQEFHKDFPRSGLFVLCNTFIKSKLLYV